MNTSIDIFKGLNQRDRIGEGELAETYNCSARRYPLLAPREKRGIIGTLPIDGCCVNDALYFCFSDYLCKFNPGTSATAAYKYSRTYFFPFPLISIKSAYFVQGDTRRDIPLKDIYIHAYGENEDVFGTFVKTSYDCPAQAMTIEGTYCSVLCELGEHSTHQLVPMGADVVIFPDKIIYHTISDTSEDMDALVSASATVQICDQQGEGIDATIGEEPSDPTDGQYWIDSSGDTDILKRWSAIYESWTQIPTTFVAIKATNIGAKFNQWDGVDVSILAYVSPSPIEIGSQVVIYTKSNNWIIVPGTAPSRTTSVSMIISRKIPSMDYVCECNNRLWGCKYGDGVNEIYASALGDPKVWNRFLGLSSDSYVASRGCPGKWTGCINYLDSPIFFKENYVEQVTISSTGAHQISTMHVNGTGCTSHESLRIVDNVLYYQGASGFYSYTGTTPRKISDKLTGRYRDSVGGDLSGFYYVSCLDERDEAHTFVYDANNALWYEEDRHKINYYARLNDELYAFRDDLVYSVRGTMGAQEALFWGATTADIGYAYEDKYPTEVLIRASGSIGEYIEVYVQYDGELVEDMLTRIDCIGGHRYTSHPLIPKRCDHFRLRFKGSGDSAIWGIYVKYSNGGKTK